MSCAERILFLYLDTGNGHAGPARLLERAVKERAGKKRDVRVFVRHGFSPSNRAQRFFYESGYRLSVRYLNAAYSLFYEMTKPFCVLHVLAFFLARRNSLYIKNLIRSLEITHIVCFHFAVTPAIVAALKSLRKKIPLTITVTDPFTAHPAWFLYNKCTSLPIRYAVFSEQMEQTARTVYGIRACCVFPFIVAPEFFVRSAERIGGDEKVFKVLIAGGGEGLACAEKLVRRFIRSTGGGGFRQSGRVEPCAPKGQKNDCRLEVSVVCARNRRQYRRLKALAAQFPDFPLRLYGFVGNMSELLGASDCLIAKAGASTVFEAQASGTPLIITGFVHGQEIGNVRYAVSTGGAVFIRSISAIAQKVFELARKKNGTPAKDDTGAVTGSYAGSYALADFICAEV